MSVSLNGKLKSKGVRSSIVPSQGGVKCQFSVSGRQLMGGEKQERQLRTGRVATARRASGARQGGPDFIFQAPGI